MPDDQTSDEPIEAVEDDTTAEAIYDEPNDYGPVPESMAALVEALQPTEEEYLPFDPTPPDPPVVAEVSTADEHNLDKPVEFDPRYREEFNGLMFIGALKKRFTWMGHTFVIRTLGTDDVLEVGLMQKPYMGTMGEIKAYQSACVAACVVLADGRPLPQGISSEVSESRLEPAFEYVVKHYQPVLIDVIYGELQKLEAKVSEVLAAMGKASG